MTFTENQTENPAATPGQHHCLYQLHHPRHGDKLAVLCQETDESTQQDAVLLLGDALLLLMDQALMQQIKAAALPLYYRQADADNRGLTSALATETLPAKSLDDQQWVELTLSYNKTLSWL